jgi:DNA-binding protein HU-beta
MNKAQLIDAVAQRAEISKDIAAAVIDAYLGTVEDTVAKGEQVEVKGFGRFERVHKPARTARNPQTGEPVDVAESWAPKFRPGSYFVDAVNKGGKQLAAA